MPGIEVCRICPRQQIPAPHFQKAQIISVAKSNLHFVRFELILWIRLAISDRDLFVS
jgi:hypothetical protein